MFWVGFGVHSGCNNRCDGNCRCRRARYHGDDAYQSSARRYRDLGYGYCRLNNSAYYTRYGDPRDAIYADIDARLYDDLYGDISGGRYDDIDAIRVERGTCEKCGLDSFDLGSSGGLDSLINGIADGAGDRRLLVNNGRGALK
ncbi:unnamed protein product, partial [Adineta steineri]